MQNGAPLQQWAKDAISDAATLRLIAEDVRAAGGTGRNRAARIVSALDWAEVYASELNGLWAARKAFDAVPSLRSEPAK